MISIITSLYKSEDHLPIFLKKIKKVSKYLTKKNIPHEFLILPNNPSKEEEELLKEKIDHVRILPRELENLYTSWNFGIMNASYANICFWNVDDSRYGKALINGLKDIESGFNVIYFPFIYFRFIKFFNIRIIAKIKIFFPKSFTKERFLKEMQCGPFFMTTKESIAKVGLFDESYKIAGDFEWCVRATINNLKFKLNNTIAGLFTNDGTTLSGSKNKLHKIENERIYNISKS